MIATDRTTMVDQGKKHIRLSYRRRSPAQHTRILWNLAMVYTHLVQIATGPQNARDTFYRDALYRLEMIYPCQSITITSKDLGYITLDIKQMLRAKTC